MKEYQNEINLKPRNAPGFYVEVFVKEITQALEQCCSAELTAFGMQKFPSKIYGIKKIN